MLPRNPASRPKATYRYASGTGDAFAVVLLGRNEAGQLRARGVTKGFEHLTFIVDPARLAPSASIRVGASQPRAGRAARSRCPVGTGPVPSASGVRP